MHLKDPTSGSVLRVFVICNLRLQRSAVLQIISVTSMTSELGRIGSAIYQSLGTNLLRRSAERTTEAPLETLPEQNPPLIYFEPVSEKKYLQTPFWHPLIIQRV